MNDNVITVGRGQLAAGTIPHEPGKKHSTFNVQRSRPGGPKFEQKQTKLTKRKPGTAALCFLGGLLFKIPWFVGKAGKYWFVQAAESLWGIEGWELNAKWANCSGRSFSFRPFPTKVRVSPSKSDL